MTFFALLRPPLAAPALALLLASHPGPTRADEASKKDDSASGARTDVSNAEPPRDGHDWVQLNTGEWLRGRALRASDRRLEFDSDRLKELSIELKHIQRWYIRRTAAFVLRDLTTLTGPARMDSKNLVVETEDGSRAVPRAELMAVAPGEVSELDHWAVDATFGVNVTRGNVEQTLYNASVELGRDDETTSAAASYLGSYAQSRSRMIANEHRGVAQLDVLISAPFFLRPVLASVEANRFKNVRLRLSLLGGAGVRVVNTRDVTFRLTAGGGYLQARYDTVPAGENKFRRNAAAIASLTFRAEVNSLMEFHFFYSLLVTSRELGLATHNLDTKLEVDVTDLFDVELNLLFDRTQSPVAEADGHVPKQNDVSFIVRMGLDIG